MVSSTCLCGLFTTTVEGPFGDVRYCHCSQCRRTSGHMWAATHAAFDSLTFQSDATLTWYTSSDWAKRGFCNACGASLFYRINDNEGIGIAPGCLDGAENLTIGKHIFVKDKADYYEIGDGKPQIDSY